MLALLMVLKEKQDGSIKGRGVVDERKQREKIESKDATSPTFLTETVMLTATINALEGRYVAVVDIPGAYMSAEMDDEVHVVFRGTLAKIMVMANPALYRHFCHMRQERQSCMSGYREHYMAVSKAHCCSTRS